MTPMPIAILRCKWKDHAHAVPTWPDSAYTGCFLPIRPLGVARYWQDCTFGLLNLEDSVVYPWRVLDLNKPTGFMNRSVVLTNAIECCLDHGFPLHQFRCVIVVVIPSAAGVLDGGSQGISTRGGYWSCSLHGEHDEHDFFAHEAGHVLGFDHAWGRPLIGAPVEYADPYCIMGAQDYGVATDPVWVAPADPAMPVHADYWHRMAPAPSGATLYQYIPEFSNAGYALELGSGPPDIRHRVHLNALDTGRKPCVAVVWIPDEERKYTVEYRRKQGWDRGVEPAVVIHSIEQTFLAPDQQQLRAVYEGRIPVPHQGDPTWQARSKNIAVLLDRVNSDGSAVDVIIGSAAIVDPLYVTIELIEGGSSQLVEEGDADVFVPPNCGERRFHFYIDHQDTVIRCKASAPGFEKPKFSWTVNGVAVPAGGLLGPLAPTLRIPVVARFPRPNSETTETRTAHISYEVADDILVLTARAQDGNYLVDVTVTATESAAASGNIGAIAGTNRSASMSGVIVRYEGAFYEAVLRCASRDLKDLLETYADVKLRYVREEEPLTRSIATLGQWQRAAAMRNPVLAEQIGQGVRVLENLQFARSYRPRDEGSEESF